MLGHVIECVTKQPLGAYFKQHIFDPLGMSSTGYVRLFVQSRASFFFSFFFFKKKKDNLYI